MTDESAGGDDGTLSSAMLGAFRRGEDQGVRAAYERYGGAVFAVAHSVLHDRELAADVVQETFVRAWRAREDYDPRQDLAPWLFTIARRAAIDTWRRRRRASEAPVADGSIVALPPSLDSIWEAFQVRLAVDRLPVAERAVVRLQHYEQLSHTEIASWFDIPLGTVKSRSFRAHRRLAEWLRPLHTVSSETAEAGTRESGNDGSGTVHDG